MQTWNSCNVPQTRWIRGEQGSTVNAHGQLVITSGYAYTENGFQQVRYNDVWRSNFSVEDTRQLAMRCGGMGAVPAAGTGLRRWPGAVALPANTMTFSPVTRRAPWTPRTNPALLLQSHARSYINPLDGSTASTGPNWMLFFEGASVITVAGQNVPFVENDVYASADNGQTSAAALQRQPQPLLDFCICH